MQNASTPADDVVEMIRAAKSQGLTIMVLPSRHRPELPPTTGLRLLLGLRPAESRALAALVQQGYASRAALHAAMFYNPMSSLKSVDVTICKLRQRLRPHGIAVDTIWGSGYRLAEDSRMRIRELLADHGADSVEATPSPADSSKVKDLTA
jgi:two-component system cell cycle response regulator CtrA